MNKFGVVLGVAAVVTLAGCKDPDYKGGDGSQNEVKQVETAPAAQPQQTTVATTDWKPAPIETTARHCKCLPGAKHTKPCACGADDCMCIVEVKSASAKPADEFTVYVVQSGDYLAKISKRFNVTISSLKRLNNMTSDRIRIGQKLKIPGKIDIPVVAAQPSAKAIAPKASAKKAASGKKGYVPYTGATKEYVVKNGDTLGVIAYGNGLNIRQLKELNGLKKDTLRIGQKLKVPVDAKAAKAASAAAKPAAKAPAKAEAAPAPEAAPKTEATPAPETALAVPATETAPAATPAPAADAAPAVEAAPAEVPAPATTEYTVQEGEDITNVAIKWGLSASDIRELNGFGENDQLKAGQKIKIPASAVQQ